jgi:serine/threonine-protein kinase
MSSSPSSGSARFGTFFLGRYRVVDEIGVGGMASVHLARADGPGGFQKWVAIKRIHPHLVEDDQFIHMFLDEARIAARISHANVAQVFDLGEGDGTYWIAMEYLHGEPLREVMRCVEEGAPKMPSELAAKIVADSAEGLHAAHDLRGKNGELLGLVHRDVTPHNLFVTYDGNVKVVDFGIAKVAGRLSSTRAGTLKGKLAYMSPEQVRGAEVDRRTDIFALGVVLWELTTGHRLFRMESDLETLEKVQACIVPPPSTIVPDYPVELESIVMKALAKNPDSRFQTARDLSRALQQHLLRRGLFVGPEDVANYVRRIFSERIKKRDAHLRWAAEVTQTINVEEFRNQVAARESSSISEVSANSYVSDVPTVGLARPAAGFPAPPREADTSRPPARGAPPPPRPAAGAPAPPLPRMGPPTTPESLSSTVADPGRRAAPAPLPTFSAADRPVPSYADDDDDDEDLATIVAPARLMLPDFDRPAPASGTPSSVSVSPSLTPASPGFGAPPSSSATPYGYGPPPSPPAMPYGAPLQPPPPPGFVAAAPPPPVPDRRAMPTMAVEASRARSSGPLLAILAAAAVVTALGVAALVVLRVKGGSKDSGGDTTASRSPDGLASADPPAPPKSADPVAAAPPPPATTSAAPPTISLSSLPPSGTTPPAGTTPPTGGGTKKDPKDPPASADNGFLTVVCNPFCDSVSAAGRNLGPSPVLKAPLPPGQHRVTLRKSGSSPKVMSVIIVSGQTSPLRVKMD